MPEGSKRTSRKDPAVLETIRPAASAREVYTGSDAAHPNEHRFAIGIELAGLSDEAKLACERYVRKFTDDLAGEAARVEESGRPIDILKPEITAAMISVAYEGVIKRREIASNYIGRKRSWADRGVQVIATLGGVATGVAAGYLHAKWQVALFTISAVLTGLSAIYVIMRQQ